MGRRTRPDLFPGGDGISTNYPPAPPPHSNPFPSPFSHYTLSDNPSKSPLSSVSNSTTQSEPSTESTPLPPNKKKVCSYARKRAALAREKQLLQTKVKKITIKSKRNLSGHTILLARLRRTVKGFEVYHTDFDYAYTLANPSSRQTALTHKSLAEVAIHSDSVFIDVHGVPFAYYFHDGVATVLGKARASGIMKSVTSAIVGYATQDRTTVVAPKSTDGRHKRFQKDEAKLRDKYGKVLGVCHFGVHQETGHGKKSRKEPGRVTTGNTGGSGQYRGDVFAKLYSGLIPLLDATGTLFEAVQPQRYKDYKRSFNEWTAGTMFGLMAKKACRLVHMGIAILWNIRPNKHFDAGDWEDGWQIMSPTGEYTGGALVLPGISRLDDPEHQGIRFAYPPGSVILLPTALIEHEVEEFDGKRYVVVQYTHDRFKVV
ncbi:hypothetical protein P7C70_g7764, partial [Phenoliferia sp. Uapishka_3]